MAGRIVFAIVLLFQIWGGTSQEEGIQIISTKELQKTLQEKKVQPLDVRTIEEFNKGHIESAKHLGIADKALFITGAKKLNVNEPIYLYCQAGVRSKRASEVLKKLGFKRIFDYSDGYRTWKRTPHSLKKKTSY